MGYLDKPLRLVSKALRAPSRKKKPPPPPPPPRPDPPPKQTGVGRYVIGVRRDIGLLLDGAPWRQQTLATILGRSKACIGHWERGRKIPKQADLDTMARLLAMARQGVDPRSITAPDRKELLADRGPTKAEIKSGRIAPKFPQKKKPKRPRSIIDPRRRLSGQNFSGTRLPPAS